MATGTLDATPLAHLLLYLSDKKLSGTVELRAPDDATATIYFVQGDPAKVRTSEPGPYLGGILVELGYLTMDQQSETLADLARAKTAGPALHGQRLLLSGAINVVKLETALREQVARKLRQVAAMPGATTFTFYKGWDGLRGWGQDMERGFDARPMLPPMLREFPLPRHMAAAFERLGSAPLKLTASADPTRLGLSADQRSAAQMMRIRAMNAAELRSAWGLPAAEADLLLYVLVISGQIEVVKPPVSSKVPAGTAAATTTPPTAPPPSAPRDRDSEVPTGVRIRAAAPVDRTSALPPERGSFPPGDRSSSLPGARSPSLPGERASSLPERTLSIAERRREITDLAARLDTIDYFTLLGVAQTATGGDVEEAFFAMAKKWHPDGLPPPLQEVRAECARVFARMVEASKTLASDERRAQYAQMIGAGPSSSRLPNPDANPEAAAQFAKAEACYLRQDYPAAEAACRAAIEYDPDPADYHALLAWVIAQKPENRTPQKTQASIELLDKVIALDPGCAKAYFWRGSLLKRIGKNNSAAVDFKSALELNPNNVDAARELRLYGMRGGDAANPKPTMAGTMPMSPDDGRKPKG
jgi:hypothetical protein